MSVLKTKIKPVRQRPASAVRGGQSRWGTDAPGGCAIQVWHGPEMQRARDSRRDMGLSGSTGALL